MATPQTRLGPAVHSGWDGRVCVWIAQSCGLATRYGAWHVPSSQEFLRMGGNGLHKTRDKLQLEVSLRLDLVPHSSIGIACRSLRQLPAAAARDR